MEEDLTLPGDLSARLVGPPGGAASLAGLVVLGAPGDPAAAASRRLAELGYLSVRPTADLADDAAVLGAVGESIAFLASLGFSPGRTFLLGFGPGGTATWLAASRTMLARAAIAWSGQPGDGATLTMPLLGLYGAADPRAPRAALLQAESRAKAAGRVVELVTYAGVGPDLADGSTPLSQAAEADAWTRTLDWLRQHADP